MFCSALDAQEERQSKVDVSVVIRTTGETLFVLKLEFRVLPAILRPAKHQKNELQNEKERHFDRL